MNYSIILADAASQVTGEHGMNALIVYGPMGVMLMWFAIRAEAKLDRIVERIDVLGHKITGVTTALLTDVLSRDSSSPKAKQLAQEMLEKIERQDDRDEQPKKKRSFIIN
jgi:hypothetical protein